MIGIGNDYLIFWNAGHTILAGGNPYTDPWFFYPPATALLFTLVALIPFLPGFSILFGISVVAMIATTRRLGLKRQTIQWLFLPANLIILLNGNIDVLLLWLSTFLFDEDAPNWKLLVVAVILTLKPQIAVVVLPWFVIRWLRQRRKLLVQWVAVCCVVHLLPLLYRPTIYSEWLTGLNANSQWRAASSASLYTLISIGIPIIIPAVLGLLIAIYGLFQDARTSWAAQLTGLPIALWYDHIMLVGAAPWQILLPVAWLTFIAAAYFKTSLPLAIVPVFVFGYRWVQSHRPLTGKEKVASAT